MSFMIVAFYNYCHKNETMVKLFSIATWQNDYVDGQEKSSI